TNYCNLQSCKRNNAIHTMCQYTSPTPGPMCLEYSNVGFTDAEKDAIVNKHNELRQRVASGKEMRGTNGPQPPAVKMPNLTWDPELATIAQRWANQCTFEHDACRNVERFAVGQNIAATSSSGKNKSTPNEMILLWYNEVKDFDNRWISSFPSDDNILMKVGHYTQIVWAKTTKIGCGRIMFKEPDNWTKHYLVCNYGPAGNVLGAPIYEIKKHHHHHH
uniref:VENOM ALLERGEN 3 n=1 Tax=Solenopsis invicta TaxID=13686 RepID=UPI00017EE972|nr:Chain A, VENOM ALLERGEN 3 [Solenopsis invicta]2VZN_B Chain B, VENOM ALLERGEN 3 [Solenopsis invicta]